MIDYKPFWETLKQSGENTCSLVTRHRISGATIDMLRKNKPVNTTTLDGLCGGVLCIKGKPAGSRGRICRTGGADQHGAGCACSRENGGVFYTAEMDIYSGHRDRLFRFPTSRGQQPLPEP